MPTTSVRRLTSRLRRSRAWSQYTFSPRSAAYRDDVSDLDVWTIDDDPGNEQLDERTSLVEVGVAFGDRYAPAGEGELLIGAISQERPR